MTQNFGDELKRYYELTPKSRALFEEGKQFLPGSDTRSSIFHHPYPLILERGKGAAVWDVDGNKRTDFVANMTTLIAGHAHPQVVQALQEQASRGTAFGSPTESQYTLAKILCERIPSFDLVRFTNSGTEATLNCIRAARAYTRKNKIAKVEGGYHGTHDLVTVSVRFDPDESGDPAYPRSTAGSPGIPPSVIEDVVVLPFNDTEAALDILLQHQDELAAIIIEPVLGGSGMVPAEPEYLTMLREFTQRNNTILIFDEVISFRASAGGAQEYYNITPDMTAMGKVIGGGLPVGAFGGKREIMELYDPSDGPVITHAGTFQGNPMTMVAGATTLGLLTPEIYSSLDYLANQLREGIRAVCAEFDVAVEVTGIGSLFGIHFSEKPIRTYRDVATSDTVLRQQVFLGLMNEGVFANSRLVGCVSMPMGEADVDHHLDALRKVLARR
ncbi:MAG: aspartate aminotransferase family protein [Chloroflexota bacterium]|nr:aspartate aminotransferase family protein [Chloroflexota bacterium]